MNDKWVRIIGIPLVAFVFMLIFSTDELLQSGDAFFRDYSISFLFTLLMWEGNRAIVMYMMKRYTHSDQTFRRLVIQSLLSIVYTCMATIFVFLFYELVLNAPITSPAEWYIIILSNLASTFFVVSIYEGAYFFMQWKTNFKKAEALAKENIRSQLEALKSQLDPHFLFNSLNTLAALIDERNEPAQKYLEQLSDVYRYVLVSKQKETVPLHEELAFVESYIYLNKTRYRDNLIVENQLPETAMQQLVPPLSLQILVENAIKHNVVSKDKPLTLRLSMDAQGYITVENNIQKKNILEKSTKTGLQNMINRYALLTTEKVEVLQTADVFSVKIPPLLS